MLAGNAMRCGTSATVLDANALRLTAEETTWRVSSAAVDLVGLPLYSDQLGLAHRITTGIRRHRPGCHIVLGGPHATALPEETLQQFRSVDFVLRGDADRSFVDLCQALSHGAAPDDVPGLSRRSATGAILHTPEAKPESNLDEMVHLDSSLLEAYHRAGRYNTIMLAERSIDSLVASRGCPFHCAFCHNVRPTYRTHSIDYLMDRVHAMVQRGVRVIEIVDDNFNVDLNRSLTFFRHLAREQLGVRLRIKSRVDNVNEEFMRLARRAGVYLVAFGAESGSQRLLDHMEKGINVADIARACELGRDHGIYTHTSWIVGYPGETPETLQATVDLVTRIRPTTSQFEILKPYPGTPVWKEAFAEGTLVGEWGPACQPPPWVRLPWIRSYDDLIALRKRIIRQVYLRPHYARTFSSMIIRELNMRLFKYALQELRRIAW